MATRIKKIRISEELEREIAQEAQKRGKPWSAMAAELLEEGIRMRRVPGIVFVDGAVGRRAAIEGGLDVWEIIATWQEGGRSYEELRQNYPWLSERQLRTALSYYERYPTEIDARLEAEAQWPPERVWQEFPFLKSLNRQ